MIGGAVVNLSIFVDNMTNGGSKCEVVENFMANRRFIVTIVLDDSEQPLSIFVFVSRTLTNRRVYQKTNLQRILW